MDAPTHRDVRVRLNQMERWCAMNAPRLGPAAVRLRALFEVAHTSAHADYIAAELRDLTAPTVPPQPQYP